MSPRALSLRLLAPTALAAAALAGFTQSVAPSWRFAPGSAFAGWEVFTEPYLGDNLPDDPASTASAVLVQTVPGAILTSEGNLYHPSAPPRFELRGQAACDLQELWLQVSTWGSTLAPGSVRLAWRDCAGAWRDGPAPAVQLLASYPNPQGLGVNQELLFTFDLAGLFEEVLEYTVHFAASAAHLSLDALLLDLRTDCAGVDGCQLGTAYCFGDGSAALCPCGNFGGPGRGCANGLEPAGARLSASGSRSVAAGSLAFTGDGLLPQQAALLLQGEIATAGGQGLPFGDGLRCAGGNVRRIQTLTPDASGRVVSTADVAARGGVSAGDTRFYQLWYRDPVLSPCGGGFNLTNGLELVWAE